jgi:hypothetical protein
MINSLKIQSLSLALGLFFAGAANAATITVTGTGDAVAVDGLVTLREAITSINAGANTNADVVAGGAYGASDTINFGIAGPGAHVILITGGLPNIIKPVTINGFSQGPGTANSAVTGNNSVHNLVIDGTSAGVGVDGLTLAAGSSGSTIRGVVIDSFGGSAINIANSRNNVIAGSFIGTDNSGSFNAAAANTVGVSILAFAAGDDVSGNQIGGPNPADRNVISNNSTREISLFGLAGTTTTGILIQNNYLGMNAAGTTAIGGGQGIFISGIQGATIGGASGSLGGSCSSVCNLIAGSTGSVGLLLNDPANSGNLIQGNFFGTDVTGTLARSNGSSANISIAATSTVTIGGTAAGTGNLISGEAAQGRGIFIDGAVAGPINIQGNFIGTTTTGNAALGNGGSGIHSLGCTNVNIGGTSIAARNVIGGNGNGASPKGPGILLEGNGPNTATALIQGNNIGAGADGTTNVGNIGNGIEFISGANDSTVGASTSGGLGGNMIAFNGAGRANGAGVALGNGNSGNKIFSNSIFSNTGTTTGLGIDLSAGASSSDGSTANDACDGDSGGNNLQNFPLLTSASSTGGSITINGTLNSTASTTFTVEFFQNSSGSQGRTRVGSTSTTTNGACGASFNVTLIAVVSAGVNITATATDPSGNTSEFSASIVSIAAPTASASKITGRITDTNGNPVEGAAIRLSGMQTRLTVTDTEGNYQFDNVETNGVYQVKPSRANFVFGPSQRTFSVLGQQVDAAFNAMPTGAASNPLDTTEYFVRQQYVDFLGREPDEAGLNFWVNNIENCGADAQCIETKRIETSAAFFLSIEFQQTGYLVYRMYQASFGDIPGLPIPVRLSDFKPDTREIDDGVIVNQAGWQTVLENNKQSFALKFAQRSQFTSIYPTTMSPAEFVDKLFANAGISADGPDRIATINEFGGAIATTDTLARARALRRVTENPALAQREFDSAFVLMQYFGYLGRDANSGPDTSFIGYNFWLTKLDNAHGDFQSSDMIKAFLLATEYRQRFPR